MSLTPAQLVDIEAVLNAIGAGPAGMAELKSRLAGLSVTRVHPSEVDCETPYVERSAYSLFLVDGADHCWRLTNDPVRATGVVIAPSRGAP
jgi:hypothetical protein